MNSRPRKALTAGIFCGVMILLFCTASPSSAQQTSLRVTFGANGDYSIAARFYMDRNFYVSDPDAFSVSDQYIPQQTWHGGTHPLTYNEAKVSISLAAVAGGMFEIGDNLPALEHSPKRLALIENQNLIDMVKLGKASIPADLMSYAPPTSSQACSSSRNPPARVFSLSSTGPIIPQLTPFA